MDSIDAKSRRSTGIVLGVGAITAAILAGWAVRAASPPSFPAEINVTNDPTRRWAELGIAVNPKDPNNIVIATQGMASTRECQAKSTDCQMVPVDLGMGGPRPQPRGQTDRKDFNAIAAFVTFDRGKTWKRVTFPVVPRGHPTIQSAGDPHITAGPDGTFYFSFDSLNWGTVEKALPNAGVSVSKSTDGGRTWSVPILTGVPADGPKIAADLSTGTIYLSASSQLGPRSTGDPSVPVQPKADRWLTSSKDGVNWTKPQGWGGVGRTASAAHGILAAAFRTSARPSIMGGGNDDLCGTAPKSCTIFQTTTDAGASWTRHVLAISNDYAGSPIVAADPTKKGHFALAVPMKGDGGHLMYRTTDAGKTWSGPVTLTEDAGKRHYHSWMAFSRQGVLAIMWRTSQPAAGQERAAGPGEPAQPYNVWAAISRDGGVSFSAPLKVSSADSPAQQAQFSGGDDYSSVAVDGNYVYVAWADWRSKERDNYFRAIPLNAFPNARR